MRSLFHISRARALVAALFLTPTILWTGTPASASTYGAIQGTVFSETGAPAANASVAIKSGEGTSDYTVTGKDGRYVFARVVFDTYTVTATAPGLGAQTGVVTVSSGSSTVLDFHLTKRTLGSVVTVAKAGHPVSVSVLTPSFVQTLPSNFKLASVTATVPGVVPFSYDEAVVRGFHGVAYQIDGVPVPQTTSSSFAEVLDPRDIGSLEVYTGSFPAEFGGSRQGGVVNIITRRPTSNGGDVTLTGGNFASGGTQLSESFGGEALKAYVSLGFERTDRGLDTPTIDPVHDAASQSNQFLRLTYNPNKRDSWALHFSNLFATFQIPIDTNPSSPSFVPPGTDNSQ
ncbi:MAG TPA: TonB-dependent receptor, partial [Candidatus Eremiobacteraceae bacterium]|nr:TonB-dependent receptor [Candidatus Eremiobacteraceae bacterium]